jgi:hypothetical protein
MSGIKFEKVCVYLKNGKTVTVEMADTYRFAKAVSETVRGSHLVWCCGNGQVLVVNVQDVSSILVTPLN